MKYNALQYTNQCLEDIKQYQDSSSNVAEYLIMTVRNTENGYIDYLTESEIVAFESDSKRCEQLTIEIENFINENYDFEFKELH